MPFFTQTYPVNGLINRYATPLLKDEKNKTVIEQQSYAMNRKVGGFNFHSNFLWYIIQKIVPLILLYCRIMPKSIL